MSKPWWHDRAKPGAPLTERQKQVIELVALGKTNVEIGMILGVTAYTAKHHVTAIRRKLGACNKAYAVSLWKDRYK